MGAMRPLLALLLAGLATGPAHARPSQRTAPATPPPESGAELRVWLVTAGPGDAVWERYGHNAIRVLDTGTGRDVSYNWGVFDFRQEDFIPRFLRGRMLYRMAVFPTGPMIDSYARADREVTLQELDLTPEQKRTLSALAERNALPENRDYLYQYFTDNCSTRARDLLDTVLGGVLRERFGSVPTGRSFRFHTRRLGQADPLVGAGMDALLGAPTDEPITLWQEMFLPMTLRDVIRTARVPGADGADHPLVLRQDVVVASERPPPPEAPSSLLAVYALIGLLIGGLVAAPALPALRARRALRRVALSAAVGWSALAGVLGTILALLLLTDHTFAHRNQNLLLFSPLSLALAVLAVLSGRGAGWRRNGRRLAGLVLGLGVVGLAAHALARPTQQNAELLALALPVHAAVLALLASLGQKGSVSSPSSASDVGSGHGSPSVARGPAPESSVRSTFQAFTSVYQRPLYSRL